MLQPVKRMRRRLVAFCYTSSCCIRLGDIVQYCKCKHSCFACVRNIVQKVSLGHGTLNISMLSAERQIVPFSHLQTVLVVTRASFRKYGKRNGSLFQTTRLPNGDTCRKAGMPLCWSRNEISDTRLENVTHALP